MQLTAHGRKYYRVTAVTVPQLTDWEASFDGGATWHLGAVDSRATPEANTWEWLVAGELADPTDAVAVITSSLIPDIRAVDSPEIVAPGRDEIPPIDYQPAQ